jgi:hypothetical protein
MKAALEGGLLVSELTTDYAAVSSDAGGLKGSS